MAEPEQEIKPVLFIEPSYLEFGAGGHSLLKLGKPDLILTITNTGNGVLTGRIKPQVSWLSIAPDTFNCTEGQSSQHNIHVHKEAHHYWDARGRFLNNLLLVISNAESVKINGSYRSSSSSTSARSFLSWIMILTGLFIIIGLITVGFFTFGLSGINRPAQTPIDLNVLFTQGAGTEIARLTLTLAPTNTPLPTATISNITATPATPTATMTFTPWPRDSFPNPETFITDYYQAINEKQYDKSWAMLSDNFKANCCNIAGNDPFEIYQTWWKPINKVEVDSAYIQNKMDQNPAEVWVRFKYFYKDGKTEEAPLTAYFLIADESKNSLLIDVAKPLK